MHRGILRILGATLAAAAGTAVVFLFVDWMNRATPAPQKKVGRGGTSFAVEKPKEKKRVDRPSAAKPVRERFTPTPRAPLPNLSTGLSGINFGIPGIGSESLSGLEQGVLGGEAALSELTMTAQSVDEPPRPEQQVQPDYPPAARAEAVTGHVKLRFLVGSDGGVLDVKVLEAQPLGVFEQAATSALRQWRYRPARYRGQAVKMWAELVMRFNLG